MRSCADPHHAALRTCAATVAEPAALTLVHTLKYDGIAPLAVPLGHAIAAALPPGWRQEALAVVPVPLHRGRERERGFNQAAALARVVGDVLALPVDAGILRRTRRTGTQTQRRARDRRAHGVESAFAVRSPEQAVPRCVLLIDDVLTTGATFHACAAVLQAGGAESVLCAAFAEAV